MKTIKVVYMGTPEFSVAPLKTLLALPFVHVPLVISQPDRPKKRNKKPESSPVKAYAESQGIRVLTPERIRKSNMLEEIQALEADLLVVAAYGQILPLSILQSTPFGAWNIHTSLLPKYRGASPITEAILRGDETTGVTLMQMDEGMDTGGILIQREEPILPDDTTATLEARLAVLGCTLLAEGLTKLASGIVIEETPQGEEGITYAPIRSKEEGRLCFEDSSDLILRKIRAYQPWPLAYTSLDGERLILLKAHSSEEDWEVEPGSLWMGEDRKLHVKTSDGAICIDQIQPSGKKPMDSAAYLRGHALKEGARFTS